MFQIFFSFYQNIFSSRCERFTLSRGEGGAAELEAWLGGLRAGPGAEVVVPAGAEAGGGDTGGPSLQEVHGGGGGGACDWGRDADPESHMLLPSTSGVEVGNGP